MGLGKEKDAEKKLQHSTFIEKLCNLSTEIKKAQELGKEFIEIVRQHQHENFDQWLEKTKCCDLPELKAFADNMKLDKDAIYSALKLKWSNGQTEGQINRLKLLKRQMFGRAKFDLLRARVLHPI